MLKSLITGIVALSLAACGNSNANSEAQVELPTEVVPTIFIDHVIKLTCLRPSTLNWHSGTAFYIGNGQFVSAFHVASNESNCFEQRTAKKMKVLQEDHTKDISLLEFEEPIPMGKKGFKISCEGFKKDNVYMSIGYANGTHYVINKLVANGNLTDKDFLVAGIPRIGAYELRGLLVRGMSGGPIVDDNGVVIGINNITSTFGTRAFSYELKNTFLCKGK